MAKAAQKTNAPAAGATATALPFTIETGISLPAIARAGGAGKEPSPYARMIGALTAIDQSFFVPVPAVPDTITDAAERAKAEKDGARKIANAVSSMTRRAIKNDKEKNFAIRTMRQKPGDDTTPLGVRVWRVAATVETPATQAAAGGTVPGG